MDDKKRDHIDPKRSLYGNCLQQLQTHIMPTDYVENTVRIREEIYDSLISRGLFPKEQKGYRR